MLAFHAGASSWIAMASVSRVSAGTAHLGVAFGFCFDFLQRMNRRRTEDRAIDAELRAVARAVPAFFQRIPVDVAAKMRAHGGAPMQHAALVAIRRDLTQALADDRALAGLERVGG